MGIDVEWRDESGKVLAQILDARSLLQSALADASLQSTQFLRFIDAYGDATFNQLQLPGLISEFKGVARSCTAEAALHMSSISKLLARASSEAHTYVTFVGD